MPLTLSEPVTTVTPRAANKWKVWLPIALFAVLWVDLVRQLSAQWEASEQYAYGWFVPFLALALFWRRWTTRPAGAQGDSTAQPDAEKAQFGGPVLSGLVFLIALLLLPLRVVYEINPDWPLPAWLMTFAVVGLSLYAVFLMGGWSSVKHFAFPICFILVAVPWPYRIEHGLTQGLMRTVANLTVEMLGWFDIPAFQRGNLIEVSTGVVGIDEACSGIRSFQSTLMAGLFLGELYRLKWFRRLGLLVGGLTLAFSFNVCRTFILTWHASASGIAAIEKWHDPAGMTIFLISFACLWLLALGNQKAQNRKQKSEIESDNAGRLSFTSGLILPGRYLAAMGCWALCILGITEVWYRSHEIKDIGVFHWAARLPEGKTTFRKIEMAPRSIKLLAFDLGATGKWQEEGGSEWSAFFFRWRPSSIQSVIHSRLHRPDICLPAAGLHQIADSGVSFFNAGELKLPFRKYTYESQGRPLYVFFCQWEDGSEKQTGLQSSKGAGRLQSVLSGRRLLGQQTFELIISGYDSLDHAEEEVRKRLPELIRMEPVSAQVSNNKGA